MASFVRALTVVLLLSACSSVSRRAAEPGVKYTRAGMAGLIERRAEPQPISRVAHRVIETDPATLRVCLGVRGQASVYAIGSSTMGSLLGPALERMLRKSNVTFNKWGKASSGLARPDFHDWPSKVPGLLKQRNPDVWVVSLGTNDYQPLRLHSRRWVRSGTARWERVYAARVDKMLKLMSPQRRRAVVWIGPTSFPGDNARKMGPIISRILRERIEAFGGPAYYIDAFAATSDSRNRPLTRVQVPGRRKPIEVRGHDGIHLTMDAVRALMARPAADQVEACTADPEGDLGG